MLKKVFLLSIFAGMVALSIPSCTYDNLDDVGGNTPCDTAAVSYAQDIVPILQANCYNCHDAANVSASGYQFDSYIFLKDFVDAGTLVERMKDATLPMPPTGLLDDCTVSKIEAWVNQGGLDN